MSALYTLVARLFDIYQVLIVVWCLMSWIPRSSSGFLEDVRGAIGMLVEPYLSVFRSVIPPFGGIDFSPVVAILALNIIQRLVYTLIL